MPNSIQFRTIDGRQWIADVGFGAETPHAPIPLELNQPTNHDGQSVRLVKDDQFGLILQSLKDEGRIDLYSFDLGLHLQTFN